MSSAHMRPQLRHVPRRIRVRASANISMPASRFDEWIDGSATGAISPVIGFSMVAVANQAPPVTSSKFRWMSKFLKDMGVMMAPVVSALQIWHHDPRLEASPEQFIATGRTQQPSPMGQSMPFIVRMRPSASTTATTLPGTIALNELVPR